MTNTFQFLGEQLILDRYPKDRQHNSWQAWDSADELLIEHVQPKLQPNHQLLIFNDDFGALSCWFKQNLIGHVSDSWVAQKSCQINRDQNHCDKLNISYLSSLASLPKEPDWVLIKIPKTLALLEYQLCLLQTVVGPKTQIIAGAKAKSLHASIFALFERYLGPTHTSLAKKKSRLVFCEPSFPIALTPNPYPTQWQEDGLTIVNHANVFSREKLDIGARFLLEHLPCVDQKSVIDLGCGNGIIGLSLLKQYRPSQLWFVDESYMAIASAQQNVEINQPKNLSRCQFVIGNCLETLALKEAVDVVVCNPPFHQQQTITSYVAEQMFTDAYQALGSGGELRIIGNHHLGYHQYLKRIFGNSQLVASNNKFCILSARK